VDLHVEEPVQVPHKCEVIVLIMIVLT
jgi:hypothetical protein